MSVRPAPMDRVAEGHAPSVITKRGRPVARLAAIAPPPPLFGAMRRSVAILGDVVAPTGERWDADDEAAAAPAAAIQQAFGRRAT